MRLLTQQSCSKCRNEVWNKCPRCWSRLPQVAQVVLGITPLGVSDILDVAALQQAL